MQLKSAGVNLAAQGVLSAAAKGIGRGITAVRGEISPADQQLLKRAAAADVPVMTSDVVPPKIKTWQSTAGLLRRSHSWYWTNESRTAGCQNQAC